MDVPMDLWIMDVLINTNGCTNGCTNGLMNVLMNVLNECTNGRLRNMLPLIEIPRSRQPVFIKFTW